MRILTHPVHTAWEYEFAKIGHEIYTVIPNDFTRFSHDGWGSAGATLVGGDGVWNARNRPMPANVKTISLEEALRGKFDVCIAHTIPWLEKLKNVSCPIIFKVHTIPPSDFIPDWAEEVISAVTFNGEMAMKSTIIKRQIFRNVIRVPIDSTVFDGHIGDHKRCLSITNLIRTRPEKRLDRLNRIASIVPVDLVGGGKEGIPYALGEAQSFEELLSCYRHYAVFLEVANQVSMSCLEAMTVGMPVVLFPPNSRNSSSFLKSGENCLVVETEETAAKAIQFLLNNPAERKKFGEKARLTVLNRFEAAHFRRQWDELLENVV